MHPKDFIGLVLAVIGVMCGVALLSVWKRARDYAFVLMLVLAPMTETFDVNFVSRDFYRGTTRGFEFSLVDILSMSLLFSGLLLPRKGQSRGYWPASFGFMLVFFAYACFNVAIADPKLFGLFELSKMVRGLTIFLAVAFFVRGERELRLFLLGLGLIVSYEGILALKQRYIYGMHRVPGSVDDSNSLSVFFCSTAPIFVAAINSQIPKWLKALGAAAIALACVGVILTISRMGVVIIGTVLAVATVATISYRLSARKIIIAFVIVLAAVGAGAKSWKTLQSRFQGTNLAQEYGNNRNLGRGYYIRVAKAIVADQVFGVGLNNWSYWVSQKYGPSLGYRFVHYKGTDIEPSTVIPPESNVDEAQAAPAHSLGALTAGELGIPGLVLFSILWMRWFQMGLSFLWPRTTDPLRRIGVGLFFALCGIFLQSLTEWVFRHSPIYYVVNINLGVLASLYYLKKKAKKRAAIEDCEEALPEPMPEFAEAH